MGVPSASNFSDIMAGGEGKVRDLYLRKLATEIVWGTRREDYRNADMDRGSAMEPQLRAKYALMRGIEPQQVGFVRRTSSHGVVGYSPDGFVGDDGLLEIKSVAGHIMIEIMRAGRVPSEHLPQCQGGMWITDRKWVDVIIGAETAPDYLGTEALLRRVPRDEAAIARIALAVEVFNEDLKRMVEFCYRWGKPE
jgi:hypothetical protein